MRAAEHPAALSSQSSAAFLQAYTQYPHRDFCLLFPPGLQPHEALTDTPRLLPTASVTKEMSQHDTATHKRATGGGWEGWHEDHSVSHSAQRLHCIPTASPPPWWVVPSAPWSLGRRCKVGHAGLGGVLEAGHHTVRPPPKKNPGIDILRHQQGNITSSGTLRGHQHPQPAQSRGRGTGEASTPASSSAPKGWGAMGHTSPRAPFPHFCFISSTLTRAGCMRMSL